VSELREAIGAAKRSGIRGCCKRAGSRGDRPRSHKLLGGCDIKQLPRVEIGLSDDRQQVRMLANLARGHCRAVRRRRPGGDWRSGRAQRILPRAIYLGLGPGSFLIAPMVEGLHGASLRAVRPDRAADI
jgi:hypothetical protein